MTEEHRHRVEDVYQEVAELRDDLPELICSGVKQTLREGDFLLPDGSEPVELLKEHRDLKDGLDRIITVLEGPIVEDSVDVSGYPVREHDIGLVAKVDKIYEGVNGGGGMKVKRIWTTEQRAVYISLATVWFGVGVTAIIQLVGG